MEALLFQLYLTENTASLDAGYDLLQIAHITCERPHLSKPARHLCKVCRHSLERTGDTLIQRGFQFFLYDLPHLVKLFGIGALDDIELFLYSVVGTLLCLCG